MMNAPATVQVDLSPKPGFCIKSTALASAVCRVSGRTGDSRRDAAAAALLPDTVSIPQGMKIFVNIAWDANVPPPPEGSEDVIQKAMSGEEDVDEEALASGRGWFVPVVVSEPRTDLDKGERKPSLRLSSYPVTLRCYRSSMHCLLRDVSATLHGAQMCTQSSRRRSLSQKMRSHRRLCVHCMVSAKTLLGICSHTSVAFYDVDVIA